MQSMATVMVMAIVLQMQHGSKVYGKEGGLVDMAVTLHVFMPSNAVLTRLA